MVDNYLYFDYLYLIIPLFITIQIRKLMTQLSQKIIKCPKCGTENKIIYYASVNTGLDIDGYLTEKLINGTLNTSICKNCGVSIRLSMDVLINCPKGMFYLNPADDLEYKNQQLKKYGVISEKGIIISGLDSWVSQAKKLLEEKEDKKKKVSPTPPPAPKISPNTQTYHETQEEIAKKLGETKKVKTSTARSTDSSPPPPPPPPPES